MLKKFCCNLPNGKRHFATARDLYQHHTEDQVPYAGCGCPPEADEIMMIVAGLVTILLLIYFFLRSQPENRFLITIIVMNTSHSSRKLIRIKI